VSAWQLVELVAILIFVGWAVLRVIRARAGYFSYFAIAFVALWQGLTLLATLLDGFVLIALPAFVARTATVLCLACGAAILILVYRLATAPRSASEAGLPDDPGAEPTDEAFIPPRSAARAPAPRASR
jgi:hypothetical protein